MIRLLFLVTLSTRPAAGQAVAEPTARGSIRGVVIDSVAGTSLRGATVQLVRDDDATRSRTVLSDSLGRYMMDRVAHGRYIIGFFHPMLDSIGLEPPVREVFVSDTTQRVDLAIPSPRRIRTTICGPAPPADSGAIVIGFVRDASDGRPAPHVRVTGEWREISFTPSGIVSSAPRLVSVSLGNGWFAMCGVPRGGTMGLTASRGEDSSGVVEIQIPLTGFARRDLYIATAPAIVPADSVEAAGERRGARTVRRGDVRLHGTVRRADTGEPIAGAQVVLTDGPYATTDARGEWTLVDAPAGTRMLEVRAVGLYPVRVAVNVMAGAAPFHISMHTLRAVLDTITVRAVRLADMGGFAARRRAGPGRFLGPSDIRQLPGRELSDILQRQPGVRVQRTDDGSTVIYIRGESECEAELYIDGSYMFNARDLDAWVRPERVAGIEIYGAEMAPPQFRRPLGGCGSVVIWTR